MNKMIARFFFFLFLVHTTSPLFATCLTNVEIRVAPFFHSSKLFREIYGNAGGSYQIETSTPLYENFEGWVNFDWFFKHGRSEGLKDPTTVRIMNVNLGIKYVYPLGCRMNLYAGIGPSVSKIWLKNHFQSHVETLSKQAVGVVLKTGACYFLTSNLFIDLFVDYLYQPIHFKKQVDIGGLKPGVGIGMQF